MPLGTPIVSPSMLTNAPVGVSWSVVPSPSATTAEQYAAAVSMCWNATSRIFTYCNQVLRSTVNTEMFTGPGMPRCNVDRNTGAGSLQVRSWPVTEVLAILISPSRAFPRVWTPVPAGQWDITHPLVNSGDSAAPTAPDGGWSIDVAPGWIGCSPSGRTPYGGWTGGGGRGSQRVQACHVNGWPHTSLTAPAEAAATELQVDDVTGWSGASGFAYDGGATEQLAAESVSAMSPLVLPNGAGTAQAGPGTVTLTSPLAFDHEAGTVVSAFPATVIEAAVYAAAAQALEGGIDSVTIQTLSGEHLTSGSGIDDMLKQCEKLLTPFRRVI